MKNLVDKVPYLRITAALSAGIVFASFLKADDFLIFSLLVVITALLLGLNLYYRFNRAAVFGLGVHLFFVAAGFLMYMRYNKKPEFVNNGKFIAVVKEILQEKTNSYQSILKIYAVKYNDSIISTDENVLVYFEKDSRLNKLLPGQAIVFNSSPRFIKHSGNPFEFNYKRYMERRKVYRQVYIPSDQWILSGKALSSGISSLAEKVRMKLLVIYRQQNWNEKQLNVLSALTLGYKRGLSLETKNTFASAGAMHILAVSGLHAGIVYLIINFLFGFLKKHQAGRLLFIFLVVILLWGFAFLTGLSPSVMRAATMFSFMVIGQNLHRQANIYNTLVASAFLLLVLNPNNLFEAGFQLSYSAVFGIVFLQPKFAKLFDFQYKGLNYIRNLLTVTVAAQIATFPVAVFYFNQFPVYFWLSNLVIIPAVTLLIPLGVSLLILSKFYLLSTFLADTTGRIIEGLLTFIEWVEQLPFSVIKCSVSEVELLFLLSALLSLFFFIELKEKVYFKSIIVLVLLFLSSSLFLHINSLFRKEIIHYKTSGQNVVHLISGKRNYIVSEETLNENDRVQGLIENTVLGLHLHPPVYLTCRRLFCDSVLYINKGLILFEGQVVHFYSGNQSEVSPFVPDMTIGQLANERGR